MLSRRDFLNRSALVAMTPLVPAFLPRSARAAGARPDAPVLVVIQLDGGNDGINTVVPFGDDGYGRSRTTLRLPTDKLLKLNDHVGLHPAMRLAMKLIDDGRLAIVQGVGYPNPNRSHFQSMRIWHSARLEEDPVHLGWVGRAFDQLPWPRPGPDAIYVGDDDMPRALAGRRSSAAALTSLDDLALRSAPSPAVGRPPNDDDVSSFVRRAVMEAYGTASDLAGAATAKPGSASYPDCKLATQLQLIVRLIAAGSAARVYYASHGSFDTHADQLQIHAILLEQFSASLKAFLDDLRQAKLSDRVIVLAFSEFGRRVAENGSEGTDHGTAGPVFVAGDAVRAGLIGKTPSLSDLDHGDVRASLDFRQVYATVLEDWLGLPARTSLAGEFERVALLRR